VVLTRLSQDPSEGWRLLVQAASKPSPGQDKADDAMDVVDDAVGDFRKTGTSVSSLLSFSKRGGCLLPSPGKTSALLSPTTATAMGLPSQPAAAPSPLRLPSPARQFPASCPPEPDRAAKPSMPSPTKPAPLPSSPEPATAPISPTQPPTKCIDMFKKRGEWVRRQCMGLCPCLDELAQRARWCASRG
jgi:hypothetical protein